MTTTFKTKRAELAELIPEEWKGAVFLVQDHLAVAQMILRDMDLKFDADAVIRVAEMIERFGKEG